MILRRGDNSARRRDEPPVRVKLLSEHPDKPIVSHKTAEATRPAALVDVLFRSMTRDPFYTIGHSTRSVSAFAALLQQAEVQLIVDVRSIPRSRANPQFNRETLPASLQFYHIDYEHVAALGGLRGRQRLSAASLNGFWDNNSFRNYADYALTADFRRGLIRLRELGESRRTCIMCAEAVWWRCHRRIIADYLIAAGDHVFHIMGEGRIDRAAITLGARLTPEHGLIYPPAGERKISGTASSPK